MNTAQSLTDPGQHIFWLASRSVGIVAILLVSVSVGLGLALSLRLDARPGAAARVKTLHEAVALTSLAAIVAHGLLLLGDPYLHPGLAAIAVPFVLAHQTLWTGIGVIAGWLGLLLGLSFYVRRWIGVALWRKLHRLTIAVFALAVAHTIGAGTDGGSTWLIAVVAIAAAPATLLAGLRLLPRPQAPPRRSRPRARIDPATR